MCGKLCEAIANTFLHEPLPGPFRPAHYLGPIFPGPFLPEPLFPKPFVSTPTLSCCAGPCCHAELVPYAWAFEQAYLCACGSAHAHGCACVLSVVPQVNLISEKETGVGSLYFQYLVLPMRCSLTT